MPDTLTTAASAEQIGKAIAAPLRDVYGPMLDAAKPTIEAAIPNVMPYVDDAVRFLSDAQNIQLMLGVALALWIVHQVIDLVGKTAVFVAAAWLVAFIVSAMQSPEASGMLTFAANAAFIIGLVVGCVAVAVRLKPVAMLALKGVKFLSPWVVSLCRTIARLLVSRRERSTADGATTK